MKKNDVGTMVGVWSMPGLYYRDADAAKSAANNPQAGAVYTRQVRVESWGKKQATLRDVVSGEYIRVRIYTTGPTAVASNPEELARLIEETKAEIATRMDGAKKCAEAALRSIAFQPGIRETVVKQVEEIAGWLAAPSFVVRDYTELVAELKNG